MYRAPLYTHNILAMQEKHVMSIAIALSINMAIQMAIAS